MKKSESIKKFLTRFTHQDLSELYSFEKEVQINVAQDGYERIGGEYKGKKWAGFTDGVEEWKSFRIPYGADSENPNYEDLQISFNLEDHVEGIGLTGWNWKEKKSYWVGFDFDSITGHSEGLTEEELQEVFDSIKQIPWVTIRKSTSGRGYHMYVFVNGIETKTHTEHAALARAILESMCTLTGFNFESKIDCYGGVMWVWHRKMSEANEGLKLLKKGETLYDIPYNWKDHLTVTSRKSKKVKLGFIEKDFEDLAGQRMRIRLTPKHREVINYLKENNLVYAVYQDFNMMITHTASLAQCHEDLNLLGVFKTVAGGTDQGDHNCFMFPLRDGSWGVRRYSKGIREEHTWEQDGSGWTRCFFNRECTLSSACLACGGVENEKGDFVFLTCEDAMKACQLLGITLEPSKLIMQRKTLLKEGKNKKLIIKVIYLKESDDGNPLLGSAMSGWLKEGKYWIKLFSLKNLAHTEPDVASYDDTVRHLVTEQGTDNGWVLRSNKKWMNEPLAHIRPALKSLGVESKEIEPIIGNAVLKSWTLVNKPFQVEYPGGREWNLDAAQLRYKPKLNAEGLQYETWMKLLNHCGSGLDDILKGNPWAVSNGIKTGGDYLKCWIASLFREPKQPLPYLFFYGPENSGKSSFHEALGLLLTKGYKNASIALTSTGNFSGELMGSIVCYTEEMNLSENKVAYSRIKEWVTGKDILIHIKGKTPFQIPNTTHWIQCANPIEYCPVFVGDTRITFLFVKNLDLIDMIPKKDFIPLLEREAQDFITEIMQLDIPESNDRLNVPVVNTEDKIALGQTRETTLTTYIRENCYPCAGDYITLSDLYKSFVGDNQVDLRKWTKIHFGKQMTKTFPQYPKGRLVFNNAVAFGNITFDKERESGTTYKVIQGLLEKEDS